MILDLTSAESCAAWWAIYPQRHGQQLAQFVTLWPQFAPTIRQAGELLRNQPKEINDATRTAQD